MMHMQRTIVGQASMNAYRMKKNLEHDSITWQEEDFAISTTITTESLRSTLKVQFMPKLKIVFCAQTEEWENLHLTKDDPVSKSWLKKKYHNLFWHDIDNDNRPTLCTDLVFQTKEDARLQWSEEEKMEFKHLKAARKDVEEGSKDDTDEEEEQEMHPFPTNHKMITRACSVPSKTAPQKVKPTKANKRLQKNKRKNTSHKKRGTLEYGWFLLGPNPKDEDDVISSVFCGSNAIFANVKEAFKNGVVKDVVVVSSPEEEHDWFLRGDVIASLYETELAEV